MATQGSVRVGVLGATSMVYDLVVRRAIQATDGVALVHEASRSFGDRTGSGQVVSPASAPAAVVTRSADYRAVLADPDVDVVYLPLPNHLHEPWVLACADAGKHILCEKPLAIDAASARRMVAACAAADVVLLEAYMSPFHPRTQAVHDAVRAGRIGQVVHGEAVMAGVLPVDNHRWQVDAGGGALLDVGIYCLEPVLTAMDWDGRPPIRVAAKSTTAGDGVDQTTSAWLSFDTGQTMHLWVSFAAADQQRLILHGTNGTLEVATRHATPDRRDQGYQVIELDGSSSLVDTGTGDCYEGMVAHMRDVVTGVTTPLRDGDRSAAVAELLDRIAVAADHTRMGSAADSEHCADSATNS